MRRVHEKLTDEDLIRYRKITSKHDVVVSGNPCYGAEAAQEIIFEHWSIWDEFALSYDFEDDTFYMIDPTRGIIYEDPE